jgi:hypothetical protein
MSKCNYWCPNIEGCSSRQNVVIEKSEEDKSPEFCLECGEELKLLGIIPAGGFLKFSSSTPQQKREVLKKRSHEHFKKEVEEKKRFMDKNMKP